MDNLDNLILTFAQNKVELDKYKKLTDKENAEIKSIMLSNKISSREVGDYRATVTVSTRESINEEELLNIAHYYGISEIIKTKEYVDFDILEKAIYDGKISDTILLEMDKAKESKEVITLKVTKLKKKKGEE